MTQRRFITGEQFPETAIVQNGGAPSATRLSQATHFEANQLEQNSSVLLEYWQVLRRHKWTVLIIAFLGTLTGFLIALPQTPVYRSRTTLEMQPLNENLLNTREVDPNAPGLGSSGDFIQTQIDLLKSDSLIERVVAKLKLEQRADSLEQPGRLSI